MATISAVQTPVAESHGYEATKSERLVALDVFRGATIAAMILVNNPGNSSPYAPLEHAKWNGWTPTDLVFPFFLFIVGVSLVLSFQARLRRGESKRDLVLHSIKRSAILFATGLALNFSLPLSTWRLPGVLQRIAVCYLAAAVITLYSGVRARILWVAALLIGYWILIAFLPVPGYGMPAKDMPLLDADRNLGAWLDRLVIPGRLYEVTRDPEGILSTLPAIATVLFGVFTGEWLRSARSASTKVAGMALAGVVLVSVGEFWGTWFPINKKMWTSSYTLFTAGAALLCLAAVYWLLDVRKVQGRWTQPFAIFGSNAISAFVLSEILAIFLLKLRIQSGGRILNGQAFLYRSFFSGIQSKPLPRCCSRWRSCWRASCRCGGCTASKSS